MAPRAKIADEHNDETPEQVEDVSVEEPVSAEDTEGVEDTESLEVDPEAFVALEDLPPETEIFPDGPTAAQVIEWKNEYGPIYTTIVTLDKIVVWRTLNREEYRAHVRQMEDLAAQNVSSSELTLINEESIAMRCILFPKLSRQALMSELAGIPAVISEEVMSASGFMALEVRELT